MGHIRVQCHAKECPCRIAHTVARFPPSTDSKRTVVHSWRKNLHLLPVNCVGDQNMVDRPTDGLDITCTVAAYRGRNGTTTIHTHTHRRTRTHACRHSRTHTYTQKKRAMAQGGVCRAGVKFNTEIMKFRDWLVI